MCITIHSAIVHCSSAAIQVYEIVKNWYISNF